MRINFLSRYISFLLLVFAFSSCAEFEDIPEDVQTLNIKNGNAADYSDLSATESQFETPVEIAKAPSTDKPVLDNPNRINQSGTKLPPPPPPASLSISLAAGQVGKTYTMTITGTGTSFNSNSYVYFSGSGITVNSRTIKSTTSISVNFTISSSASTGSRYVRVSNATGYPTSSLYYYYFYVIDITPSPDGVQKSSTKTVTVTGNYTTFNQSNISIYASGSGWSITNVTVNSTTSVTFDINVLYTASTGTRTLTISNCRGTVSCTKPIRFTNASISPNYRLPVNNTYNYAVTGYSTDFDTSTTVTSSDTCLVPTVTYNSPTSLTVSIGNRLVFVGGFLRPVSCAVGTITLTLTTGTETTTVPIYIYDNPAVNLSPSSAELSQTVTIRATKSGSTGVAFSSSNISAEFRNGSSVDSNIVVTNVNVINTSIADITAIFHNTNTTGTRTLRIYNCNSIYERDCDTTFTLNADSTPPSFSFDKTYMFNGDTIDFAITGTNTSFVSGTTYVTINDATITPTILGVSGSTSLNLRLATTASTVSGTKTVTFHTAGEHVSANIVVRELPVPEISILNQNTGTDYSNISIDRISVPTSVQVISNNSNYIITSTVVDHGDLYYSARIKDTINPGQVCLTIDPCDAVYTDKSCVACLNVVGYPAGQNPVITSVTPNQLQRGNTTQITITADYMDFSTYTPTITAGDLTVYGVSVLNSSTFAANVYITRTKELGKRTISVEAGPRHAVLPDAIEVIRHDPVVTGLTPNSAAQSESKTVSFTVDYVSCSEIRSISFTPEDRISVASSSCTNAQGYTDRALITANFRTSEFSPIGSHIFTVNTTIGNATYAYTTTRGTPYITISPLSGRQLDHNNIIATPHHFDWPLTGNIGDITSNCPNLNLEPWTITSAKVLEFKVNPALTVPASVCTITFSGIPDTELGPMTLTADYTIINRVIPLSPTADATVIIGSGEPAYFSLTTTAGDILKLRTLRDELSTVDPVLTIADYEADFETPLYRNDDEHLATYDSLALYHTSDATLLYVRVEDRLDINTGEVVVSRSTWSPEQFIETAATNDSTENAQSFDATTSNFLLRGDLNADPDVADWYLVTVPASWPMARVRVLSLEPLGDESGLYIEPQILGLTGAVSVYPSGGWTEDPEMFVDAQSFYVGLNTANSSGGLYFLNVTPGLIINEIHHDEDASWYSSYVEIYGYADSDLTDCRIEGTSYDTSGLSRLDFSVGLDSYLLDDDGYLVIAHDDMVPGVTSANIESTLGMTSESGDRTVFRIDLICGSNLADRICYGTEDTTTVCSGYKKSPSGETIGRGYNIYTNRTDEDFHVQPEMTPWQPSLVEVSR
ncbi:hypothetical protein KKF34_01135 [Myxococcota bacterium]|nr:hypothetical protein [Myxococcota bacterium]MBU1379246.1 hypothetical protein [Myxococcota bacterium]MBU1495465.1 hypothetical protein [Myxococcota bacterium]